jgi:hypothetical protein
MRRRGEAAITPLGEPRWVLAPNLLHHLFVGPWLDAGLEGWACRWLLGARALPTEAAP